MDLVDEEDVAGFERGQEAGEVAGFLDGRAARTLEVGAPFVGDDVGEGGLAEPRRTAEQDVVERLVARPGGLDEELQLLFYAGLAGKSANFGGRRLCSFAVSRLFSVEVMKRSVIFS